MDELLWVTTRGLATRGRSRQRLECISDAMTPFLCTEHNDKSAERLLFAALSVGLTPEAVPRIVSVELAASPDAVLTLPVDPYGCNVDGMQTPGELWSSVDSRFFARFNGGGTGSQPAMWCFRGRSVVQGCVSLSQALQELLAFLETEVRKRGFAKSVLVLASPETELPALLKACGDRGLRDRYVFVVYEYSSVHMN